MAPPVAAQYVVTFLKPEMLHIYRQITALRAFRPVVFCQKREHAADFPFDDLVVLPKPRSHQLRRFVQKQLLRRPITIYRSEAGLILAALHAAEAKVLHIYFGHIGVHLLPLLEICDLPVIVSFHGADARVGLHPSPMRRMLEKATLLLVRSESLGAELVGLGCDRSKIRLHRTGIPFDAIPFVQRTAPPDGEWYCLQASRLIPKKGLVTSLRAFAEFAVTYPRAKFTIAGDGPQLAELKSLACSLGVAERVSFTGFLSQDELRLVVARSHLFLHPSELTAEGDQEGVPNSMLEAMAAGLPALATIHGGIPEAVENDVSGLLVAEKDHNALAGAMVNLTQDAPRYVAMSAAAARRVAQRFEIGAQTRTLESYYAEAMAVAAETGSAASVPS